MKKQMNLVKTAQLNVDDILSYLNHSNLNQEKMKLKEQQRTCGGLQLNVRLNQNWITGPPDQFTNSNSDGTIKVSDAGNL